MKRSQTLKKQEFALVFNAIKVYSLIGLSAYYNKHFKECSRAFTKLEKLESLSDEERDKFEEIAVSIFLPQSPFNYLSHLQSHLKEMREGIQCDEYKCLSSKCKNILTEYSTFCKRCGCNLSVCVASGASIFSKDFHECKDCRHKMLFEAIKGQKIRNCSLCHSPIDIAAMNKKIANLKKKQLEQEQKLQQQQQKQKK